jgi:hypothetical protein
MYIQDKCSAPGLYPTLLVSYISSPCYCFVFETGSHYVAQAELKLEISCFCLLNAGITGVHHNAWLWMSLISLHNYPLPYKFGYDA